MRNATLPSYSSHVVPPIFGDLSNNLSNLVSALFLKNSTPASFGSITTPNLDINLKPFSNSGTYVNDYDIVNLLPIYQQALQIHLKWALLAKGIRPKIVDAGGGTGNMSLAIARQMPLARVHLLDLNQAMLEHAKGKGFPERQMSLSNISDMRDRQGNPLTAQSVHHVLSHSVLWALKNPESFFREAHRVLKDDGTLAVSTINSLPERLATKFVSYLDTTLASAQKTGLISLKQRRNFVESNQKLIRSMHSQLSKSQLIQLAERNGFEAVEVRDAYVIPTPGGERPTFTQALFRKSSSGLGSSLQSAILAANRSAQFANLGIRLFEARSEDVEELTTFMESIRKEFQLNKNMSEILKLDDELQFFEKHYRTPTGNVLIIRNSRQNIVGSAAWSARKNGVAVVEKMYLAPELRKKGLGKKLLVTVMAEAFLQGYSRLELETISAMTGATELYERVGFRRVVAKEDRGVVDRTYQIDLRWWRRA